MCGAQNCISDRRVSLVAHWLDLLIRSMSHDQRQGAGVFEFPRNHNLGHASSVITHTFVRPSPVSADTRTTSPNRCIKSINRLSKDAHIQLPADDEFMADACKTHTVRFCYCNLQRAPLPKLCQDAVPCDADPPSRNFKPRSDLLIPASKDVPPV